MAEWMVDNLAAYWAGILVELLVELMAATRVVVMVFP